MIRLAIVALVLSTPVAAGPALLRISVFELFRPQRLAVKPAAGTLLRVRIGQEAITVGPDETLGLRRENDAAIDCFLRRRLTTARRITAAGEFLISVPGRIERRFRGELEVTPHAGALLAVVGVELETAVASVVAAELAAPATHPEALAAQAVAARSYYLAHRSRHGAYDFCDTTHCQFLREPPAAGVAADRAAAKTRGVVLVHHGKTFPALYSAACGGRTRTAVEAGFPGNGYPYFAVECEPCRRDAKSWRAKLPFEDARVLVEHPGSEPGRLEIVRKFGWRTVPGNNYEVRRDGSNVILEGRGAGHGVGLCQHGAAAMGREGRSWQEILWRYFPAAEWRSAKGYSWEN